MGLSVAAATAIIFTGLVISYTIMHTTERSSDDTIRSAEEFDEDYTEFRRNTAIEIDNATYSSGQLYLNMTNAGSTSIDLADVDILIEGAVSTDTIDRDNITVEGTSSGLWLPLEGCYVPMDHAGTGIVRIKVAVNGIAADYVSVDLG